MENKVILILVDGMRPDALDACKNSYASGLLEASRVSLNAQTVMPSVTLPCHMSLFHSVDPERHGITTNAYTPQVRPVEGLVERLDGAGKRCAFFYTWEELRDLSRPGHLAVSYCLNMNKYADTDKAITKAAISYICRENPDFLFLYLGETDEVGGHDKGWMSETYLTCVSGALDCVRCVRREIPKDYTIILVADHGGHGRSHGEDCPEDMTIPVIINGPGVEPGNLGDGVSIKDIAPTVAALLGVAPSPQWEGKALL